VIGTLATSLGVDPNNDIYILSGDKDLYSLTTKNVKIYDTMKGKIFDDVGAKEKFLVDAPLIIDYLAIIGDTSDNIPGVAGF
jgi:DNA polymerase-1